MALGLVEIALGHERARGAAQLLARRRNQAVDEGAYAALGQRAGKFVRQLAVDKRLDVGDAAHAETRGQLRMLVGIDLGQQESALVFAGQLLQDGFQHPARGTPRRPKIDQHRHFLRRLQHVALEGYGSGIKQMSVHGGSSGYLCSICGQVPSVSSALAVPAAFL